MGKIISGFATGRADTLSPARRHVPGPRQRHVGHAHVGM